ncbi:MAG: hypothetical protein WC069_01995 [Candidatus Shapirobacteria bacterium]
MQNRILLTITLSLFFFQIAFSIIYSNIIVKLNQQYSQNNKKYLQLSLINQTLEVEYAKKHAINQ